MGYNQYSIRELKNTHVNSSEKSSSDMNDTAHPNLLASGELLRTPLVSVGTQWVVDACGCDPLRLQSLEMIGGTCNAVIHELGLHVIGLPASHRFASPHGVTMLYLLSESHLAVHTYPEHALATFNFVCCREHADWPWTAELRTRLNATHVDIRVLRRGVWYDETEASK